MENPKGINEKLFTAYDPANTEPKIYKLWEDSGFFNPDNLPERHVVNDHTRRYNDSLQKNAGL
jgi:hypothetical protein